MAAHLHIIYDGLRAVAEGQSGYSRKHVTYKSSKYPL